MTWICPCLDDFLMKLSLLSALDVLEPLHQGFGKRCLVACKRFGSRLRHLGPDVLHYVVIIIVIHYISQS